MDFHEVEKFLFHLADKIDGLLQETFGAKIGFALLLFDFNKPGIGNYVSNGKREDMIIALRETATRLENNEYIPPAKGGIH